MALKSAGCVLFLLMVCGYSSVEGEGVDEPAMTNKPLFNYGTKNGDNEIDDFSKNQKIELPFNISYFGSSYKYLYVSPDGILGFEEGIRYLKKVTWSEGVRNPSTDLPFLAPFLYSGLRPFDIDPTQYQGHIYYRLFSKDQLATDDVNYSDKKKTLHYLSEYLTEAVVDAPEDFEVEVAVIVTWDNVASESEAGNQRCTDDDPCNGATFQAVLASDRENTFAIFNYLKMEVPFQPTFQAGFNGGYQRGWFNVIPCHGSCAVPLNISRVNDLPNLMGSDLKGRYILDVGDEVIVRGGCLPGELKAGMLEVHPREIGMFGGELLEVSGRCLRATSKIYCRFGSSSDSPVTNGAMANSMKGYCPVPLLTVKGPLRVYWSSDGQDWSSDKIISVVLPSMTETTMPVSESVKEKWLSRHAKTITIPWDKRSLSESDSARVDIKLIGYREIGSKIEYKTLENFGTIDNSQGMHTVDVESHRCKEHCDDFEMGLLEVSLPSEYHGVSVKRVAIRYGPIPLGWWVNEELTEHRDSDWSDEKCRKWHSDDSKHEEWIKHLLPCPCSLDQAIADFGRWQPDPGCNLYTGSKCHYHIGAKHCVRSVVPTVDGAGNQCCYNNDGTLRYSQLSYQGSTPDRSHVWGAAPYGMPDHVPSLSHWKHDVISFYYCCLWNDYDLCDLYMEQRPTADCRHYDVPGIAFLRGDPHITTFDGQTYQFGGFGDFWLVKTEGLLIQGRFKPRDNSWDLGILSQKTSWKPSALTALAIQGQGQIIEVHPAPENAINPRGLDIRVGDDRHFFLQKSTMWQDFQGQSIVNNAKTAYNNPHNNFTILMSNNVGINVVGANGLLHVTVVLPPSMKQDRNENKGLGLMGTFDENKDNDFTSPSGTVTSPGSDKKSMFENFGMSWQVKMEDSLFPFHKKAEVLDTDHSYFEYKDIPSEFKGSPTSGTINSVCQDNEVCKWDYKMTGDINIARATKGADETFAFIKSAAYRVENCGLPKIGEMATLTNYNFSVGQEIRVTGCGEDKNFEGEATFRCLRERLDEAEEKDRDHYGMKRFDDRDNVEYVIHWVPEPYTVCSDDESADIGLIIGIVAGCLGGIVLIGGLAFFIYKKRKSSKSDMKLKPAKRDLRESGKDPASAEAMLSKVEERSPVYKPSREPVRMSEIQGSNV